MQSEQKQREFETFTVTLAECESNEVRRCGQFRFNWKRWKAKLGSRCAAVWIVPESERDYIYNGCCWCCTVCMHVGVNVFEFCGCGRSGQSNGSSLVPFSRYILWNAFRCEHVKCVDSFLVSLLGDHILFPACTLHKLKSLYAISMLINSTIQVKGAEKVLKVKITFQFGSCDCCIHHLTSQEWPRRRWV